MLRNVPENCWAFVLCVQRNPAKFPLTLLQDFPTKSKKTNLLLQWCREKQVEVSHHFPGAFCSNSFSSGYTLLAGEVQCQSTWARSRTRSYSLADQLFHHIRIPTPLLPTTPRLLTFAFVSVSKRKRRHESQGPAKFSKSLISSETLHKSV